ncbi:MAG: AAA family ATPase [Deltaproteobacteria bacterium]|nr:AAA family ATPase [Deltaproteobacteria bacterium]
MLVWVGAPLVPSSESRVLSSPQSPTPNPQSPVSYTPPHLAERIRAEQAALEARGTTDGERKTITALFADLKGSTALIEGLDPEEARAIIDPALQLMMDAVHQYDGYVAQALGDGIFALFGAPLAHEDHPQRALYAALRMQEAMRGYADTLRAKGYLPLQMRVGVNTGEVVVRSIRKDDLHTDYVPVGHSTNLAARMEQLANPGSIVVSAYTHRLTDGYFAFKDLGPTQIKGVEEALNIYEVLGAGPLRTRLQVSARRGLTRFVGRQSEMEQLRKALEHAKAGHGQIVGTMGEPGLGKSRLFYEFKLLSVTGCLVLEAYSVSHGKATAYLPVIELLKGYFDIQSQDDERKRREKVGGKVLMLDRSLEDTLPYLFALLGIEEQPSPLQQMDPQIRRRRTFEALKKLFLRESLNQPLVLIFEDLHWIDGETQGFLDVLTESVASAKLLLLTNYRPEYRHEWGQKTYYTQLRLAPLGREEAEEFLDVLLENTVGAGLVPAHSEGAHKGTPLQSLKQLILDKTQGTPFFMEEIVQELVEQGVLVRDGVGADPEPALSLSKGVGPQGPGAHTGAPLQIPSTVQGILAARIDRLAPDEKALLQQLSVIGREFPLSLIRRVLTQPEEELYRLLASLQRKEFLYEQPAFPEVEYIFKHALTQEVAYGTVLIERRKGLHEQSAQAIEQLFHDRLEEHYDELAHHYSRSGNTPKAVEYLHLAGQQAVQRSANVEAITHFTAVLELLKTLPDTPERTRQELMLHVALGAPLIATKGYGASEVEHTYARARELCRQVGETPQLYPVLRGLFTVYVTRAEFHMARELAEQLLGLAQSVQDSALLVEIHSMLGLILCRMGDPALSRAHLEQGSALYNPQQHRAAAFVYGQDAGVACRSLAVSPLWLLGYPDQALQRSCEGLALAKDLSHPFSLAMALGWVVTTHILRREWQAAQQQAETAIALCTEYGFPMWLAFGTMTRGLALAWQGRVEEGLAQIHQGMIALQTTGTEIMRADNLARLAEAYGKAGRAEEGLTLLTEALAIIHKTGGCQYEAEVYRIRGELLLAQEGLRPQAKGLREKTEEEGVRLQAVGFREKAEEAEKCFYKAIEISQKQQAKSLELRAVMSLARLRQSQATQDATRVKLDEAHQMLAEVYNWFTEGFDTKDLREAKALLEELA